MDSLGFFIDIGGQEEDTNVENDQEEVIQMVEDEVMGAKDAQTEAKQRNRARTERSLSTFLFGKTVVDTDYVHDDGNDTEEDEGIESENVDECEDEEKEKDIQPISAQPSMPDDIFGSALGVSCGKRKRKAAWVDKEDSEVLVKDVTATFTKAVGKHGEKETSIEQYGRSLSRKFKSVVGEPTWASLDKKEDEDSDEEFLRETTDLVEKKGRLENLQKGTLQFRKLKDVNYSTHKEGAVIRSTEFHPTSTVGMVAGNNGTASLFQIDGKENPKIQTVNFENFPIKTAKFSANGNEIIVGSQHHPHFFVYDMMIGKTIKVPWTNKTTEHNTQKFEVSRDGKLIAFIGRFGFIHIISARTKEFLKSFKMNDSCQALKFSPDSSSLYSTGEGGEVYIWDLRSSACLHKFADSGCLSGTAVAVSSHHLAIGSSSGVVNVYNVNNIAKAATAYPQPDKVILNLTTQIEDLVFNPTGEILAMSSMEKEGAVKLVHFPSTTVFANFPGSFNLARANSLSFSPGGGYFSVGNNKGAANLYRVNHYKEY
eukprot:GFUD01089066.1.p1 GENE.GFUD01089066.1~~GFUD01089066.1.p1  ORF type:complete len:540 (-),score=211.34 GFUD01089066.1:36-1655(-)